MRSSPLTIVCSGMIAADPHYGGATWAMLQYLLGFARLGHEVYFVEPVSPSKLGPSGSLARSAAAQYFEQVSRAFGLTASATLLREDTHEAVGLDYEALLGIARRTDVLFNVSGMLTDRAVLEAIPRRVYLDLDPGFNQAWSEADGIDMRFEAHTHFATVGLAVGKTECLVPTCGRAWITTCPPVVLGEWGVADRVTHDAFTTVANWRSYGSIRYQGAFLGQKVHALRPLVDLPARTRASFALALAIHPDEPDLSLLHRHGWTLLDPRRAAGTPGRYQRFIRGSFAEFGLAKSGYVAARTGWVSDRSACYLASGRPVLTQDTGIDGALPTGEGLLTFATIDAAVAGVEAIVDRYAQHREAARAIAERFFDSRRVLPRLLDAVGGTS
jgi:hypothetical protein